MNPLYAHGKLLISAEYLVLHGSKALAVPLRLGQILQRIRRNDPQIFSWRAFYQDQLWFTATLDPGSLKILSSSDPDKASYLKLLIQECIALMPSFQEDLFRMDAETTLEFSPDWGFGSSSSLTALMAEWAEVNPLDLHFAVSEGSGFDVACAIADGPLIYRLRDYGPHYQHVKFRPPFKDSLYFAWLGRKQATASHLENVAGNLQPDFTVIHQFSCLTEAMVQATELSTFQGLMQEHEEVLSAFLGMERISESRFPGLPGTVKSLGAWGGDFVMIASEAGEKELFDYLYDKDIQVIYRYGDLVHDETELQQDASG